jgi:drug/metabolite transporter (DMT)-like permease
MNAAIRTAPGAALALASAALFGASTPLAKLLLGSVDPWLLASLLYLGSGIGLALLHGGRIAIRVPPTEAPLRRADLPWLAAIGQAISCSDMSHSSRTTADERLRLSRRRSASRGRSP